MTRRPASLHRVPPRSVPRLPRYYQDAPTPVPPSHRARCPRPAVPLVASSGSLPSALDARPGARKFRFRHSQAEFAVERNRSPRFLGNPRVRLPGSLTPAGPNPPRRGGGFDAAPAIRTARAPAIGCLSGLHRLAFALAVYASQGGSPHHHARLASGCRLGSTGWDWLPKGFQRKVSKMVPTSLPPSPGFAWRKPGSPRRFPAQGSHRSGRAPFGHPAPQVIGSLRNGTQNGPTPEAAAGTAPTPR
jgi:hypothetical protein